MPDWPSTLPAIRDGYTREAPDMSTRNQPTIGPPLARKLHTSTPIYVRGVMVLTGAQAQTLESFYIVTTDGGSIAFQQYPDPLTDDTSKDSVFLSRPGFPNVKGDPDDLERLYEVPIAIAILP